MAAWARSLAASGDEELRQRVEYAASRLEDAGNEYHLAALFDMAGLSSLRAGRDQDATRYLQRAVPLARRLREAYPWMHLRTKVGVAAIFTGEIAAAHDAFGEALTLSRTLVVPAFTSLCLDGLAAVAAVDGDLDRAARLAGAAAAHRAETTDDTLDARLRAAFLEPARAASGIRTWDDVAARDGAALTIDEAIEYALEGPRSEFRIHAQAGPHH